MTDWRHTDRGLGRQVLLAALAAAALAVVGCDDDDDSGDGALVPIAWTGAQHYYGVRNHFLTLTEIQGPVGSTLEAPLPGKYVAKGRFKLTGSEFAYASQVTMRSRLSGSSQPFVVAGGSRSGEFEVSCVVPPSFGASFQELLISLSAYKPSLRQTVLADQIVPYGSGGTFTIDPVLAALSPVVLGRGVAGAGAYSSGPKPHKVVLLDADGKPYSNWNDKLPVSWFPQSLDEDQLVACLKGRRVAVQTCNYIGGSSITRYRRELDITLRAARSGKVVAKTTMTGGTPGPCPARAPASQTTVYGSAVPYEDVEKWLRPYVTR